MVQSKVGRKCKSPGIISLTYTPASYIRENREKGGTNVRDIKKVKTVITVLLI